MQSFTTYRDIPTPTVDAGRRPLLSPSYPTYISIANGLVADLDRTRSINKKVGQAVVERRKARAVKKTKPRLVSSVLKAIKKLGGKSAKRDDDDGDDNDDSPPSTPKPKRTVKVSAGPPRVVRWRPCREISDDVLDELAIMWRLKYEGACLE